MTFEEMVEAVRDARRTIHAADSQANDVAYLLEGRLRHCDGYVLAKLKRELKDFNPHTKEWMR
jgi:hypothetical protein